MRNSYKILVGKPDGRSLGRLRRRWKNNIKLDLKEIGWEGIHLAQDRDQWRVRVNAVMNIQEEFVDQSKEVPVS
jgi:hypothetical protein